MRHPQPRHDHHVGIMTECVVLEVCRVGDEVVDYFLTGLGITAGDLLGAGEVGAVQFDGVFAIASWRFLDLRKVLVWGKE